MTSNQHLGFNSHDNASEVKTVTTWGNDWPQVGLYRSQLYNEIIKAGYDSNNYVEVGNVVKNLIEWRDLVILELEGRIVNSEDPNILPDPALNQSLRKLHRKIHIFCDRHLLGLRQRIQQLRREDLTVIDLLDLTDDEGWNLGPPNPLQFDASVIPHPRPPIAQVSSGQTQPRMPAPIQANPMFTLGQQSVPSTFRHATPTVVQSTPTTQTVVPPTLAPQPPVVAAQVSPPYTRPPTVKITEFDGSVINATQWLKNYVTVTRAMGWNDKMRANLFSNYMTGPALLWFQSRFGAQNDESIESLLNPPELSLSDIFTAFQERFRSRHARMEFEGDYIFFAPKPEESLVETFWRYQKISGLVSASTPILDRIHHLSRRLFEYNPTVAEQISPCKTFEQVESTMQRLSAVGFKSRNADDNKNKTTVVQPNAQKGPSNRPDDNIDQVGLLKGDRPIKPVVDVVISGKVYRALLDDGSENSFISTRVAHFIKGFRKVKWDRSAITTANGQVITPETAFADLNIQIPALAVDEKCYVGLIKNLAYDLILGEEFQERIRLIKNYGNRTLYIMENFDELYRQHKKKNDRKFQWSLVEESDQPRSNICLLTSSFSDQCPLIMAKTPNKRDRRSTTSEAQNVGKVKSKDGQVVSGRLRRPSSAPGGSRNYPTVRSPPRRRCHTLSDFRHIKKSLSLDEGYRYSPLRDGRQLTVDEARVGQELLQSVFTAKAVCDGLFNPIPTPGTSSREQVNGNANSAPAANNIGPEEPMEVESDNSSDSEQTVVDIGSLGETIDELANISPSVDYQAAQHMLRLVMSPDPALVSTEIFTQIQHTVARDYGQFVDLLLPERNVIKAIKPGNVVSEGRARKCEAVMARVAEEFRVHFLQLQALWLLYDNQNGRSAMFRSIGKRLIQTVAKLGSDLLIETELPTKAESELHYLKSRASKDNESDDGPSLNSQSTLQIAGIGSELRNVVQSLGNIYSQITGQTLAEGSIFSEPDNGDPEERRPDPLKPVDNGQVSETDSEKVERPTFFLSRDFIKEVWAVLNENARITWVTKYQAQRGTMIRRLLRQATTASVDDEAKVTRAIVREQYLSLNTVIKRILSDTHLRVYKKRKRKRKFYYSHKIYHLHNLSVTLLLISWTNCIKYSAI